MGRRRIAAAVAAVAAFAAGSASAAPVKVAGPTPSGATLVAFDRGHRICTTLRGTPEDSPSADCTALPSRTRAAHVQADPSEGSRLFVRIVVPAGGASEAEVVGTNGASTRIPIGPGDYAGRLHGLVAFGLAELPSTELRIVRFFDSTGKKIAVYEDFLYSFLGPPAASAPFAHAHGWRATAQVREELRPSPLDAEHRERRLCMTLRFPRQPGPNGPTCSAASDAAPLYAAPQLGTCATPAGLVVFTARVIDRVKVTFGDGSTTTRRTKPFPLAGDGERAAIVIAPRRLAIRSVQGVGPGGAPLGYSDLGIEPAVARCAAPDASSNGGVVALILGPDVVSPPLSSPSEPTLVARQQGDELCLGIGRIPSVGSCQVPSAEEDLFQETERRYTDGSVAYAGLVDPRIASVTAIDAGGRRVSVPTQALPPEAGDYVAVARGFVLRAAQPAVQLRLRNAAGRLEYEQLTRDARFAVPPFRVAAGSGGVRLLVAGRRLATRVLRDACVVVVLAHERPDPEGCATLLPDVGEVWVPCAQRRTIVYGRLPRRASGAHLELGSGATVAADVDRRTRAWIAVAPSVAALRAIVVTGRGGSRFALSLPPAARQCGYSSFFLGGRY